MAELTEEQFVEKHSRRNAGLYVGLGAYGSLIAAFGDTSVLIPNLALRLGAPTWLAALPMVLDGVLAYVPQLLIAWWLTPERSRRKITALAVGLMYAPFLIMGGGLLFLDTPLSMQKALMLGMLLYAMAHGLSILPSWDLYGRVFTPATRSWMMGISIAVGQAVSVLSGGAAAWLISSRSPFDFPLNYAVPLITFAIAGMASVFFYLRMKEYRHDPAPREPFGRYISGILPTIKSDAVFRNMLLAAAMGASVLAVGPVLLGYAKACRGFSDDHVAILIGIRPVIMIPVSLLLAWAAARHGAMRLAAWAAAITALGAALTPLLHGLWQIIPQLLGGMSTWIYVYALLGVMNLAPSGQRQRYLALFYAVIVVPTGAPLVLGWIVERNAAVALGAIFALAGFACALFFRVARMSGTRGAASEPPLRSSPRADSMS